jgi:PGF-pre-PGF domain-containing protein
MKRIIFLMVALVLFANVFYASYTDYYTGPTYPTGTESKKISVIRNTETFQMQRWRNHGVSEITLTPEEEFEHTIIRFIPKESMYVPGSTYIGFELEVKEFWGIIDVTFKIEKRWLDSKELQLSDLHLYTNDEDNVWQTTTQVQSTSEDEKYYYFKHSMDAESQGYYALSTLVDEEVVEEEPEVISEETEEEEEEQEENTLTGQATQTVTQGGGNNTLMIILVVLLGAGILGFGAYHAYGELTRFKPGI